MTITVKPDRSALLRQRETSKRLAKGLCPLGSQQYLPVTDTLVRSWEETAASPLPQNLLDLCKALEEKLLNAALPKTA
jgi:hypothetical protein